MQSSGETLARRGEMVGGGTGEDKAEEGRRRGRQGWGARMRRCEEEEDMRTRERGGRLKAKCPSAVRETDTSGLIFACVK